jgi:ribA/ribD-fused uncharacterized protein
MIDKFEDEYRFLSNFWKCTIEYEGITYPSTEHAYQAQKTLDPETRIKIAQAKTEAQAKRMGKTIKVREDWNDIKLKVMEDLLRIKFKIPELRQLLIDTGTQELVEGNWWKDYYWGVCNGKGKNYLGKLLMKLRKEIQDGKF